MGKRRAKPKFDHPLCKTHDAASTGAQASTTMHAPVVIDENLLLRRAIAGNNIALVQQALDAGADAGAVHDDDTPLAQAVLYNREDIVRLLLKALGATRIKPLHLLPPRTQGLVAMAAMQNNPDLVTLLLHHGAPIDPPLNRFGAHVEPALTSVLRHCSADTSLPVVVMLVERGAAVDVFRPTWLTPVAAAARHSNPVLRILMQTTAGRGAVNAAPRCAPTPLRVAAEYLKLDNVELLLANGADPNQADAQGWTPLMAAANVASLFETKVLPATLRPKAPILAKGILRALLGAGAAVNARARDGSTALHWAAVGGFARLVRCLLRAGATVDAADADGWTPLMAAVWHRHDAAAAALREAGARDDTPNGAGQTAAALATFRQMQAQ